MGYDFEVELREQKNRFANISIRETAHRVGAKSKCAVSK